MLGVIYINIEKINLILALTIVYEVILAKLIAHVVFKQMVSLILLNKTIVPLLANVPKVAK